MTAGKRWGAFGALLAVLALAVAAVGAGVGASKTNAQAPIVIGWAYDSKGNMAPFDNPALRGREDPRRPGQREGRRQRASAADRHLRHEQQQRGEGEVVRGEPAREGCERHLHDLRRRSRDAGRAGVDQARQADAVHVHRHRPDGAEAVRQGRQARVQLRQRRPGRGLRDGGVRLASRAGGRPTSPRTPTSSTSRTSSRRSTSGSRSSAARSPHARATRPARTTSTRRSVA